jgi:hypothetical protein
MYLSPAHSACHSPAPPSHRIPRDTANTSTDLVNTTVCSPSSRRASHVHALPCQRVITDATLDVQISTGVSQWDLPTSEAPIGGSSSHSTPAQNVNPYNKPDGTSGPDAGDGTRGMGGHGESTDRAGGLGV